MQYSPIGTAWQPAALVTVTPFAGSKTGFESLLSTPVDVICSQRSPASGSSRVGNQRVYRISASPSMPVSSGFERQVRCSTSRSGETLRISAMASGDPSSSGTVTRTLVMLGL